MRVKKKGSKNGVACRKCHSTDMIRYGRRFVIGPDEHTKVKKQQWQCKECGTITINPAKAGRDSKGRFMKKTEPIVIGVPEEVPA